jgi:adenine-specific DNA-methyltransferase
LQRPDPDSPESLTRVRASRRGATPAEQKLWTRLRSRQLHGHKFRRQVWLGPFIADFFCAEAKLVVEVDGDTHAAQIDYDRRRTDWLAREGFRVVRVANEDVMQNIDGVLEYIASNFPSPSQSWQTGALPLP